MARSMAGWPDAHYLLQKKIIPRDLSIVCFQGAVPVAPRFSGPRIDYEEMGRRAVRLFQFPRERRILESIPVVWASGQTLAPPRRLAK